MIAAEQVKALFTAPYDAHLMNYDEQDKALITAPYDAHLMNDDEQDKALITAPYDAHLMNDDEQDKALITAPYDAHLMNVYEQDKALITAPSCCFSVRVPASALGEKTRISQTGRGERAREAFNAAEPRAQRCSIRPVPLNFGW